MARKISKGFDKFQKKSNAAKKEEFRQEKRKWKKEREEYFEQKKSRGNRQSTFAKVSAEKSAISNRQSAYTKSAGDKPAISNRQSAHAKSSADKPATGNKQLSLRSDNRRKPTGSPPAYESDRSHVKDVMRRPAQQAEQFMPLNKFISNSGVCSRRDAAELVKQGAVVVNGKKITEPGHKVTEKDEVKVNGKKIQLAKNLIYVLLNKPKDYLTTADDPQQRKTVLDLIKVKERIFPVGRLDRNTSGVLLLTNDGELSQRLTHPSHEVKKIYHVVLNKPLDKKDFDKILNGVMLDDGMATVDVLAYADLKDKTQIGLEIHSGRNRIVRRLFEKLGYDVRNLDRVMFAGLTKKNVDRGKWRFLNEKEIRNLKFFGKGK